MLDDVEYELFLYPDEDKAILHDISRNLQTSKICNCDYSLWLFVANHTTAPWRVDKDGLNVLSDRVEVQWLDRVLGCAHVNFGHFFFKFGLFLLSYVELPRHDKVEYTYPFGHFSMFPFSLILPFLLKVRIKTLLSSLFTYALKLSFVLTFAIPIFFRFIFELKVIFDERIGLFFSCAGP